MIIEIVVAEPDATIRRVITHLIRLQEDMRTVGQAADAEQVLLVTRQKDPHVVLLSDSLASRRHVEMLKESSPRVQIIVLGNYWPGVQAVKDLGVSDFVLRDRTDRLMSAVRRAGQALAGHGLVDEEPPGPRVTGPSI